MGFSVRVCQYANLGLKVELSARQTERKTRPTLISKPRHFISMEEDIVLVCRNAFYLDSLNINDLTLPNSTWLYPDSANSNEYLLLTDFLCILKQANVSPFRVIIVSS